MWNLIKSKWKQGRWKNCVPSQSTRSLEQENPKRTLVDLRSQSCCQNTCGFQLKEFQVFRNEALFFVNERAESTETWEMQVIIQEPPIYWDWCPNPNLSGQIETEALWTITLHEEFSICQVKSFHTLLKHEICQNVSKKRFSKRILFPSAKFLSTDGM